MIRLSLLVWLVYVSAASAADVPSATQISADIKARGAHAVVNDLTTRDQWDTVTDRIAKGGSEWIALAPLLAPGSDAGSAEDLGIVLAYALPKNPVAVLKALDPSNGFVIGADRVCGIPFIENSVKDRPKYKRKAIRAVKSVKAASLLQAKKACLAKLQNSR